MQTVVHVTHEAIQKIGGIGAVLQGLFTSRTYLDSVQRNILVGPYWPTDDDRRAAPRPDRARCSTAASTASTARRSPAAFARSSSITTSASSTAAARYVDKETGVISTPEVLLIDVSRVRQAQDRRTSNSPAGKSSASRAPATRTSGISSSTCASPRRRSQRCTRWAPRSTVEPCVILSHEYMGMPTCLAAILEGERANFRTIFYAHEVATMRRIVEGHPGHDTMFYNVMRTAMAQGHYVEDVFGDQSRLLQARAC